MTAHDHVRVIDLETTGFPPGAEVVEVAFCDVVCDEGRWLRGGAWSTLVNPGIEIPAAAMAVHHITDEEVKGLPPFGAYLTDLKLIDADNTVRVYAAHNMQFERAFFNPPDVAWICTWRCAVTVWPEAPGFKNQELRYWLGLKLNPAMCQRPHRAPDDAYVTAALLVQLLKHKTVEQLIEISANPVVLPYFTFGMHAMVLLNDSYVDVDGRTKWSVPTDYLEFFLKKPLKSVDNPKGVDPDVRHTCFHHMNLRRQS